MRVKGTNVCKHSNCNITMKVGYKYQNDVKIHNIRAYAHFLSNQHYCLTIYLCKCKALYEDIVLQMYCEGYNTATHIQFSYFILYIYTLRL